jgi:hypothetical protein
LFEQVAISMFSKAIINCLLSSVLPGYIRYIQVNHLWPSILTILQDSAWPDFFRRMPAIVDRSGKGD